MIKSASSLAVRPLMQHTRSFIRIWDLPTRLFHWALAACVIGAYASVKLGGLYMEWHVRFGLATLGLVAFRLVWGLIGPRYARFATRSEEHTSELQSLMRISYAVF